MEIMTRKQAFERNQHKYFTGKPCSRGHLTLRYVNTGACMSCIAVYSQNARQKFSNKLPKTHWVSVELLCADDERAVRAYVASLNFQRELESVANGNHFK